MHPLLPKPSSPLARTSQVQVILDVLGTPSGSSSLGFAPRDDAATFLARQRARAAVPWRKVFPPTTSQPALDLVAALLVWVLH
jgi:hypothetical protein